MRVKPEILELSEFRVLNDCANAIQTSFRSETILQPCIQIFRHSCRHQSKVARHQSKVALNQLKVTAIDQKLPDINQSVADSYQHNHQHPHQSI